MLYLLSYAPGGSNVAVRIAKLKAAAAAMHWESPMKRSACLAATVAVLMAAAPPSAAQQSATIAGRWQLTLEDGSYVWDIRLIGLQNDSLLVLQADTVAEVPVAQITEVRLIQPTEVQVGSPDAAGATMAALSGQDDEIFDLQTLDFADRLARIRFILESHPLAK